MNIEKMSKWIEPICDNRSGGASHYQRRRILISLPRVKWLDRQPDYEPWPDLPSPEPEPEPERKTSEQPRDNGRFGSYRASTPSAPNDRMSPQQREIWEMHLAGLPVVTIATRVGKSANAVSKSLSNARHKLGIGLK
jgi:hypothetical protein